MSTVPVLAPDGSAWDIPQEQVASAIKAGGKIAADMTAPDGSRWTIPLDRVHEAIGAEVASSLPLRLRPLLALAFPGQQTRSSTSQAMTLLGRWAIVSVIALGTTSGKILNQFPRPHSN